MSTKERYGRLVWDAIVGLDADTRTTQVGRLWFTAAQVAERAGVSVMTARKHLNVFNTSAHVGKAGSKAFQVFSLILE